MTEALPLGIDRIHTATGKEALPDKPLPVNLVLVFLAWVLVCDKEYFY